MIIYNIITGILTFVIVLTYNILKSFSRGQVELSEKNAEKKNFNLLI